MRQTHWFVAIPSGLQRTTILFEEEPQQLSVDLTGECAVSTPESMGIYTSVKRTAFVQQQPYAQMQDGHT